MKKRTITVYIYLLAIFFLSSYRCYADTVWSSDAPFNQGQIAELPCIPETHMPGCDAENDETKGCKLNGETLSTIKVRMGVPSSVTLECNSIDVASIVSFQHKLVNGANGETDYLSGLPYEAHMPPIITPSTISTVGEHEIQAIVYIPSCQAVDRSFFCYTINSATLSVDLNVVGSATPVRNGELKKTPPAPATISADARYQWEPSGLGDDGEWEKEDSGSGSFSGGYEVKYEPAESDLCTDSYILQFKHNYEYEVYLILAKNHSGTPSNHAAAAASIVGLESGHKFGLSSNGNYGIGTLTVGGLVLGNNDMQTCVPDSNGNLVFVQNNTEAYPAAPWINPGTAEAGQAVTVTHPVPGEVDANVAYSNSGDIYNEDWDWIPSATVSLGLKAPTISFNWNEAGSSN